MPPLYYLIDEVLRRLRRTQRNMSDLIIQVLVRKLSNINHRHIYVQTSAKNNWKLAAKDIQLPKPDESFVQASGTKAQVLALLSHTELQRYKPRLKE